MSPSAAAILRQHDGVPDQLMNTVRAWLSSAAAIIALTTARWFVAFEGFAVPDRLAVAWGCRRSPVSPPKSQRGTADAIVAWRSLIRAMISEIREIAGAGGLDGGVQGEPVRLFRDRGDQLDDVADLIDPAGDGLRIGHGVVDERLDEPAELERSHPGTRRTSRPGRRAGRSGQPPRPARRDTAALLIRTPVYESNKSSSPISCGHRKAAVRTPSREEGATLRGDLLSRSGTPAALRVGDPANELTVQA